MELDSEVYEPYDQLQRDKSTGSGLVLAVPAMVLDTRCEVDIETRDNNKPMVVTGEYENLVTDNQYYEQVEFGKRVEPPKKKFSDFEDSLYSIPQVISSNNSTTGLTTNIAKV